MASLFRAFGVRSRFPSTAPSAGRSLRPSSNLPRIESNLDSDKAADLVDHGEGGDGTDRALHRRLDGFMCHEHDLSILNARIVQLHVLLLDYRREADLCVAERVGNLRKHTRPVLREHPQVITRA